MGWETGSALRKSAAVIGVALLLLLPLAMLHGLVTERTAMRAEAIQTVARGWGGPQSIGGPVLAIPVTRTLEDGHTRTRDWYVLPESVNLEVEVAVEAERRKLGVYEVPVYVATVHATGEFDVARESARLVAGSGPINIHLDRARLLLPLSDPRGVRQVTPAESLLISGAFEPWDCFPIAALSAQVRSDANLAAGKHPFEVTVQIAGTQFLGVLPLARASNVRVSGNWPDPGFARGYLPTERQVHAGRFSASWRVLDLNRSYGAGWQQDDVSAKQIEDSAFGVDLVQPVDLYQQTERASKYAGLFIGLSFLTLFIWEHLARRPVHPIQYALMGLALSVFFLLVLALAEHVGFPTAYLLAALALCLLMGVYMTGAMKARSAGVASGALFAGLYALLYLVVTSDSYALLAGALGLFGVLATAMVLTRNVDWYAGSTPGPRTIAESAERPAC